MRCGRCEAVFRVRPPAEAPAPVEAPSPPPQEQQVPPTEPSSTQVPERPQTAPQPQREEVDRERLVLVAMPDVELAKQTASALVERGLQASLVHDGVEAMLEVQRQLPRVVVLSASLPKMFGFQICEVMKRNESLRSIAVVLAASIHHTGRYRREPNELYGADAYLEDPDLPGGLIPILERIGVPMLPAAVPASEPAPPESVPAPAAPPESAPAPAGLPESAAAPTALPESAPVAPPQSLPAAAATPDPVATQDDDGLAEGRAKAERLARIIVSDIILYNEDKFAEALRQGSVVEMMSPDLDEGRDLFCNRIDERVREERDYLVEELLRVARQRGAA
jgi:CheY-like chemotaxis protein